ncbi:glycosyltransferase family 2 protein [Zeimonas arvi]|uniref:Glycosyltransferase family 2 protein n=1 Tax=Zeimonas arvi TaxID=2498847 RepID=A0A5C8NYJ1_9BURK|nr:glycosyltransferase family 2 protein [Zeimonas arvi]TXL66348.1 glycosyltransferase family 2 protein [Zeimonas arvi]
MDHGRTTISVVVPFYNEAAGVEAFFARLFSVADAMPDYEFDVVAVNDGSTDVTLARLLEARERHGRIHIVDLSRNFGKEAALSAGLDRARGEAVIPIDSDLQHPPELIPDMIRRWRAGAEVVLARRNDRVTDGPLQKFAAGMFYRMHNVIAETKIPPDVGDFRLMSQEVVEVLRGMPENRRFMKGLFAWVGFRSEVIPYDVAPRLEGKSRFNVWKLWNFALEGITSFSTVPLRVWTYIGAVTSLLALVYAAYIVIKTIFFGTDLPGYASLMVGVLLLGGIQLIGIGVLGEYIGRIYGEVKRRPVYVVRKEFTVER